MLPQVQKVSSKNISMAEKPNQSAQDRLSALPISLLHLIVSDLPTHGVVQTCVLSEGWRNFWCSVPTIDIDFSDSFFNGEVERLEKFMNYVLLLRDGSDIQKLRLNLTSGCCAFDKLNEWILYAVRHNLLDLSLRIDVDRIQLPRVLFTSKSLRKLAISHNKHHLILPTSLCLPALETLHFSGVAVGDGLLDAILSAAPSLGTLILDECNFTYRSLTISTVLLVHLSLRCSSLDKIDISAPCLKSLTLHSCRSKKLSVDIYAPTLVSLDLDVGAAVSGSILIKGDLMSLTHAVIGTHRSFGKSLFYLVGMVRHACSLHLKSCPSILKSDLSLQMPFSNLKSLSIETLFSSAELKFINNILKLSPQIESLFLGSTLVVDDWPKAIQAEPSANDKEWSKYELSHLKLVEIQGFRGSENELKMVKFLLENAITLESLVINVAACKSRSSKDGEEIAKSGKKLIRYPRASSSVNLLLL